MTCGVSNPEMFRTPDSRVYGYLVASGVGQAAQVAKGLYFLGAQHIFADEPKGNVRYRPGFNRVRNVMRAGDMLILSSIECLGSKHEYQQAVLLDMESEGVSINIAT